MITPASTFAHGDTDHATLIGMTVPLTGLISRSAPSLNLFALGLPAGVAAGIAALIIALPVMTEQFRGVIETALEHSEGLLVAGAPDG